jgi:hypothetical protein
MRVRHFRNSDSLGNSYLFGFNIYRDGNRKLTIDLILGKHVFALIMGEQK